MSIGENSKPELDKTIADCQPREILCGCKGTKKYEMRKIERK
jgi:hypothetical protein